MQEKIINCACKVKCGDVPQEQDHPEAVCKMLPGLGERILDAIIEDAR